MNWDEELENFKSLGKENDYIFQVLSFMGEASYKMNTAFTLTENIKDFPKELEDEFRDITTRYWSLQSKVRELRNDGKINNK